MASRFLLCCGILLGLSSLSVCAQDSFDEYRKKRMQDFNAYRNQREKDFEEYRRKRSLEFARYLEERWKKFEAYKGIKRPVEPKPKEPVVFDEPDTKIPDLVKIPIRKVVPVTPAPVTPSPVKLPPLKENVLVASKTKFMFLNTPCYLAMDQSLKFTLKGISEKNIADAYKRLSGSRYDAFYNDCAQIYQRLNLNGWGAFLLTRDIAKRLQGAGNEAVLLQAVLMTQLGYDVRMGVGDNRLCLMMASTESIAEYGYLKVDGRNYYIMDSTFRNGPFYTYEKNIDGAVRPIDFDNPVDMKLDYAATTVRQIRSLKYPQMSAQVSVNRNLIDYYKEMPPLAGNCWNVYARQALENPCYRMLLPQLRQYVTGKGQKEAASMLLDWVQTGFQYKTDDEQFGYEKPFFKEEIFFYPYCDCEDRSILYSYLIHQLLQLDVVFIYSPGHVFTAVCFDDPVEGDYIQIDGKKYIICDPTYIGADVGRCMPNYKNASFEAVRIDWN